MFIRTDLQLAPLCSIFPSVVLAPSKEYGSKGSFPLRSWNRAFFVSFIDFSALKIEANAKQSKSIKQTKNNLFHARSGKEP